VKIRFVGDAEPGAVEHQRTVLTVGHPPLIPFAKLAAPLATGVKNGDLDATTIVVEQGCRLADLGRHLLGNRLDGVLVDGIAPTRDAVDTER
jgi:hypothetical protein